MSQLPPEFWSDLESLRDNSQLVLSALERDDLDEVTRLARESDELMVRVKPGIEARMNAEDRDPSDSDLVELIGELKGMNDRILDGIGQRQQETVGELGRLRGNKTKLRGYKPEHERGPVLLDRQG